MAGRLEGKVASITGGASGMGLSAAQIFAAEGAKVVAADISEEALESEVGAITAGGGTALELKLDVSSPESWAALVATTLETFGTIDILVNNAGIHMAKGILGAKLNDWNKVMAVNSTGVKLGMQSVIPTMQANGGGSIVNVSSIAGILGGIADAGGPAYSASKGAVRSLSKHAAQWFAKDSIRVNSIHPGSVFTGLAVAAGMSREDMAGQPGGEIPLPPHVGEPSDIANGMLYLASNESKYVTGIELVIDGGWISH